MSKHAEIYLVPSLQWRWVCDFFVAVHHKQRFWYYKQFWVFCAPRVITSAIVPTCYQGLQKRMWVLCLRNRRWQTEPKCEGFHEAATCSPVYRAYHVCPKRRPLKKFFGLLREEDADKRPQKCQKWPINETPPSVVWPVLRTSSCTRLKSFGFEESSERFFNLHWFHDQKLVPQSGLDGIFAAGNDPLPGSDTQMTDWEV